MTDKKDRLISELEEIRSNAISLAQQQELLEDTLQKQKQAARLKELSEPNKMYKQIGAGYLVESEVDGIEDEIEENIELTEKRLDSIEKQKRKLKEEFSEKQSELEKLIQ